MSRSLFIHISHSLNFQQPSEDVNLLKKPCTPTRYFVHSHFEARKSFMLEYLAELQDECYQKRFFILIYGLKHYSFYYRKQFLISNIFLLVE